MYSALPFTGSPAARTMGATTAVAINNKTEWMRVFMVRYSAPHGIESVAKRTEVTAFAQVRKFDVCSLRSLRANSCPKRGGTIGRSLYWMRFNLQKNQLCSGWCWCSDCLLAHGYTANIFPIAVQFNPSNSVTRYMPRTMRFRASTVISMPTKRPLPACRALASALDATNLYPVFAISRRS